MEAGIKNNMKYIGKTLLLMLSAGASAYQLFRTLHMLEEIDKSSKKLN